MFQKLKVRLTEIHTIVRQTLLKDTNVAKISEMLPSLVLLSTYNVKTICDLSQTQICDLLKISCQIAINSNQIRIK